MPIITTTHEMSSARSSSSPTATSMEPEEPRKKGIVPEPPSPIPHLANSRTGARGGKRSVTHLSKAQLARKRANDREAQRNIRQRTKEHIETLERKVKELEEGSRAGSMERVLARNRELESEIENLRVQMSSQIATPVSATSMSQDIPEELLIPQKVELDWIPGANSTWPQTSIPSHIPSLQAETPTAPFTNDSTSYPAVPAIGSASFGNDETKAGYTQMPNAIPIWDDPSVFGQQSSQSQSLSKQPVWTPFHPAFSQPSRFADLQQAGFQDVINNPSFPASTCWQSQPSIYAWQISTKLKAPVTQVDHLMLSVIQTQRHLAMTTDLTGEDIIGPDFPPVHVLFNQPGPSKPPTSLMEVMARYAQVLSNRGFALIPEKLASFMCMYRFVQWQSKFQLPIAQANFN
jgi:hypothetical protein